MMKPTLKILILEDNADDILLLKEMTAEMSNFDFADTEFEMNYRESLREGIQYLKSHLVDLIILDLTLLDSQGLNTLQRLREAKEASNIPIIVLTVMDDKKAGIEAVKMGAQEYLVKSDITARFLSTSIRYALERHQLKLQLEKETEELEQSENQFIEILTSIPDGVIILDKDNTLHFMNPAAEDLLGRENMKSPGKSFAFPMITDESESREIEILRQDGNPATIEMRGVKVDWKGQDAWLISLRDITGKKKLLKAFSQEKERLDITLRSIVDGVITTDQKGVIRLINWMAVQMTGWPQQEAVGKPLADVLKLKDKTTGEFLLDAGKKAMTVDENIEIASSNDWDWILISRSGNKMPIEYSCAPVLKEGEVMGLVLVMRDTTEKKELEEDLKRSRNLEALGVLARGIAHEYNNILTSTLGYISLAKVVTADEHKIFPMLQKAEEAGIRAKEISYRLLTFSKGGEPQKRKESIVNTLEQAANHILKSLPITTEWHFDQHLWPVMIDRHQVSLAVSNILKNAAEALSNKGSIEIKVKNFRVPIKKSPIITRGNYVKITITDQGSGIPDEYLPKIFDPYFTTKEKAEGMGLTTAYSIIRKHGGWIGVKSKKDQEAGGTTVTLLLPAAVTLLEHKKPAVPVPIQEKEPEPPAVKKRKILVMDDEDMIREITREMLEFIEYEAVAAEDGEEALELYQSAMNSGSPIEVVILDLVVPTGMGGKECIQKLQKIDPNVIAVVSSGYSDDPVVANYQDYGFRGVLSKPYKIDQLKEILEQFIK
jgi:two-component system cell cycle sensor histidine kinase/response regulator CckA